MNDSKSEGVVFREDGKSSRKDLEHVREFIDSAPLRKLADDYRENNERREVDLGFNPFALVSDLYYRENFHSDVLAAILDPQGAHGKGSLFLHLFLVFLRDRHGVDIDLDHFRNSKVVRESAKIDILISDEDSKRAIIIENKINGAPDMKQQVVRYLGKLKEKGRDLECEAIVYLPLLQMKTPERSEWPDEERGRVDQLLRIVCAYRESGKGDDLYHGWLEDCEKSVANNEVKQVISHYRQLILKLGRNAMNIPLMEKFCELVKVKERYQAAIDLDKIMNDLPAFRCQQLLESFQGNERLPFSDTSLYRPTLVLFHNCGVENLKIHVETTDHKKTVLSFWNNIDSDEDQLVPAEILSRLGRIDQFKRNSKRWFVKEFQFPGGEPELYKFIETFLAELRDYLKSKG